MMNRYRILQVMVIVCGLLFVSCGGGGDSGAASTPAALTPTASSAVSMTISGKTLNFSWVAGSNVDHYRISVNPDGASGFTVDPAATNIANTATSHSIEIPVHKTNWLAAQYIVEACNADESSCVASTNQTLALIDSVAAIVYVKASNTGAADTFGWSVALSGDGNTLAVGSHGEDSIAIGVGGNQADNTASLAGAVYVFSRTGSAWTQQAYVKASNTEANDSFGRSVALSDDGNTLAVGADGEDSAATGVDGNEADNATFGAGAVYVFSRTGSAWTQQAYVKASNTGTFFDSFGRSVALSGDGNTLAVSADGEDSAATGVDGNQADNTGGNTGAVYVFSRVGATWTQQAYVKASNTGANDLFGWSVALSGDGNTLAVGAYGEDSIAIGVGGNQMDNTASDAGAVYVFSRVGATWTQQAYVKASNTEALNNFGWFVALSGDGNTLAVGADGEDSAATGVGGNQMDNTASVAGAVYVFSRTGSAWTQQAYVKASNTGAFDTFGRSVALSGDGNTLAVGAEMEASAAFGINGDQVNNTAQDAGAVYLY